MEKRTKKFTKTLMGTETNQSSQLEQISSDQPVALTIVVTWPLLPGHIPNTTWRKRTGKVQQYSTLGTAVILGDFTLLRGPQSCHKSGNHLYNLGARRVICHWDFAST